MLKIANLQTLVWKKYRKNWWGYLEKAVRVPVKKMDSPTDISIRFSINVGTFGTKYSRVDQVKFVEDSL